MLCGFCCGKLRSLWARAKGKRGGVITRDLARRERITEDEIESGSVFIKRLGPFEIAVHRRQGKRMWPRKLSSYGVKEFVNIKTGRGVAANRPAITSRNFTIPGK